MTSNAGIQKQVAREAGMSFERVVKRYADAGHSMTETALLLGYSSRAAFLRLCRRHGYADWFNYGQDTIGAQQGRAGRRGQDTDALQRARQRVQYPTVEYQGIHDTYAGHARRLGLALKTVRNRSYRRPHDLDYIFSVRSHTRPPRNDSHPWRSGRFGAN